MMVVGHYVTGNMMQHWIIEKDQICCEHKRQLRVDVDGTLTAGVRCQAFDSSSSSSNGWLFDHQ